MIEFKGISVQTRTLLLAGAAIAAIIVLWPEDERKSEAGIATSSERAGESRPRTMRKFEQRPLWQQQPGFEQPFSAQPAIPGHTGQYPKTPYARQVPRDPRQTSPYEGFHFRNPYTDAPPPGAHSKQAQQRQSPYLHTPQPPAPQFRPLEKPRRQTRPYYDGYPNAEVQDPTRIYPPPAGVPGPSTQYSDRYDTPWEYPAYQGYPQTTIPPEYGSYPGY